MSGHTKGPWSVAPVGTLDFRAPDGSDYYIVSPDKTCVAIVWFFGKEGEANANLLASAPALLAALEELLAAELSEMPGYEAGRGPQDAWADRLTAARNNARALIQSARGSQS